MNAKKAADWLPLRYVLFRCVRQQRYLTGAFDRYSQKTLILCTCTSYTTWQNFAALADKFTKQVRIFIVNVCNFVSCEETYFTTFVTAFTSAEFAFWTLVATISLLKAHVHPSFQLEWQIIFRYIDRASVI
ncbi:hypothetical protein SAMN05518855_1007238 [Paenibacillus sp. CF384]|nr:hypothetical protein SAMN05518855_1007238 [Paenibacillus sp. CF384]